MSCEIILKLVLAKLAIMFRILKVLFSVSLTFNLLELSFMNASLHGPEKNKQCNLNTLNND